MDTIDDIARRLVEQIAEEGVCSEWRRILVDERGSVVDCVEHMKGCAICQPRLERVRRLWRSIIASNRPLQ